MADMMNGKRAGGVMGAVRDYGLYRRTVRELNSLSDQALSDLGISRHDIRSAARIGTYGR